jgi:hypothetical protein
MRRKLRNDDGKRCDERIAAMLDRHVRGTQGSAQIKTGTDAALRSRLATESR